MDKGAQLRLLSERLRRAPQNLWRIELQMLINCIDQDEYLSAVTSSLAERHGRSFGGHIGSIVAAQTPGSMNLHHINTPDEWAAHDYLLLTHLLETPDSTKELDTTVWRIGAYYSVRRGEDGQNMASLSAFVDLFVDPLIDYLTLWQEREDRVLASLTRYKHRSEWFHANRLMEIARSAEHDVERSLKLDFYEYLFDLGLDFTIDPNTPDGGGRVDVLSAMFPDSGRLVLEAKVFDGGESRNRDHVRDGIGQAAYYAEQWQEPSAFLLVYNIARDAVLSFTSAREHGNYWLVNRNGKRVFLVALNLAIGLIASDASQLQRIEIPAI